MVKIISGIDPQTGGYNPKIWSSHKDTENFMSEEAVSNSAKSITEGAVMYSIHFFERYYVFSKHKIVRDQHGDDRIGTLSFSIAVLENESNVKIIDELEKLETDNRENKLDFNQRNNDKPSAKFASSTKEKNKKNKIQKEKEIVYLYYNKNEFEQYFHIDGYYKKYKRIFFIHDVVREQKYNPLQSIRYDKEISVSDLQKPIKIEEPKNPNIIKSFANNDLIGNSLIIGVLGILIGIGIFWGYQEFFSENYQDVVTYSEFNELQKKYNDLNNIVNQKDNEIKTLQDSINKLKTLAQPASNKGSDSGESSNQKSSSGSENDISSISQEITQFLTTDCKTMTLNEIETQINSFPKKEKTKSLMNFASFITIIKKNPPQKQDISNFIKNNKPKFDNNDEYVKFVYFLETLEDNDYDNKKMSGLTGKTLRDIEKHYGFNN